MRLLRDGRYGSVHHRVISLYEKCMGVFVGIVVFRPPRRHGATAVVPYTQEEERGRCLSHVPLG